MTININLLKSKLALINKSISSLAEDVGMNKSTFYRKVKGESDFTRKEISDIITILDLNSEEMCAIFFARKVA